MTDQNKQGTGAMLQKDVPPAEMTSSSKTDSPPTTSGVGNNSSSHPLLDGLLAAVHEDQAKLSIADPRNLIASREAGAKPSIDYEDAGDGRQGLVVERQEPEPAAKGMVKKIHSQPQAIFPFATQTPALSSSPSGQRTPGVLWPQQQLPNPNPFSPSVFRLSSEQTGFGQPSSPQLFFARQKDSVEVDKTMKGQNWCNEAEKKVSCLPGIVRQPDQAIPLSTDTKASITTKLATAVHELRVAGDYTIATHLLDTLQNQLGIGQILDVASLASLGRTDDQKSTHRASAKELVWKAILFFNKSNNDAAIMHALLEAAGMMSDEGKGMFWRQ